uniref:Uncharacterized protein n=1 Tax=Physcomitrium patens TaxID=3218 RepID=A0A2K1IMU2_PHYPA|nr:hypothetical protein PHYPA_026904 [Physcomitrium patens]
MASLFRKHCSPLHEVSNDNGTFFRKFFSDDCRAERQQWAHKVEKLVLDEVQHWHES